MDSDRPDDQFDEDERCRRCGTLIPANNPMNRARHKNSKACKAKARTKPLTQKETTTKITAFFAKRPRIEVTFPLSLISRTECADFRFCTRL